MVIVMSGPAGAGKTTAGRALAAALGWSFADADDLHSPASIDKMSRGVPLDDADRGPWLERVRELILRFVADRRGAVVACSALRERYRHDLSGGSPDVRFVLLAADRALLEERLDARRGHFAGRAILDRQLAELEPPGDALVVSSAQPVAAIVRQICAGLALPCEQAPADRR